MAGNQSLERGLAILDLLDRASAPMGVREIGRALNLNPTIVQRLANSLSGGGYLEQVTETRKYRLGYRAMLLGGAMMTEGRLMAVAGKELQVLADRHFLNGYLGVLRDRKIIYLLSVQSSGPVTVRGTVGAEINAHSTALGKALIAELANADVKPIVGRAPYEACTPNTITQWTALAADLERVRGAGFAVSQEENISGIVSYATVVRDSSGKAVAALSVASLASEHTAAKSPSAVQLVLDAAHRCSLALGYRGAAIKLPQIKRAAA
jgi:DNA-binding IclR family transcriptional regulator